MQKMNPITKRGRRWHRYLCGLWCAAGAAAVGGLLTYLTNGSLGILSGLAMAGVMSRVLRGSDGWSPKCEDLDFADELRTGLMYCNHPGNILNTD